MHTGNNGVSVNDFLRFNSEQKLIKIQATILSMMVVHVHIALRNYSHFFNEMRQKRNAFVPSIMHRSSKLNLGLEKSTSNIYTVV